ncbi:MAG: phosphatidylglycerophosphatase A, partial [Planctomycetaceae bacterium]|nr:phosphatidylglycerophosphatase A [Planctomycetaceae bacterium]
MKTSDRIVLFLAEGFGAGMVPKAPGTIGSLWGLLIGWLFAAAEITITWRLVVWAAMCVVGVPICAGGARIRGRKDPG